jgi:hypothetical protein
VQQGLGLNPILNSVLILRKLGFDQRWNFPSVTIQDPPRFESGTTTPHQWDCHDVKMGMAGGGRQSANDGSGELRRGQRLAQESSKGRIE